jgi:hypothetical protein
MSKGNDNLKLNVQADVSASRQVIENTQSRISHQNVQRHRGRKVPCSRASAERPPTKYDGNCESETQPEFVAKDSSGVPGVTVPGPVKVSHLVTSVWVGCSSMISMCRVIYFELQSRAVATPSLLSVTRS